jgi:hypothetical protein
MSIEFSWNEIKPISQIESIIKNECKGIYMWGFKEIKIYPYYIGQAIDIKKRLYEHINNLIGGKYSIYSEEQLSELISNFNYEIKENPKYRPNWPIEYQKFIDQKKSLDSDINNMLECMIFSYFEVDENTLKTYSLKDLEKYVINKIGKAKLANSRGGDIVITKQINFKGIGILNERCK